MIGNRTVISQSGNERVQLCLSSRDEGMGSISKPLREDLALDPKERKRHDRFNGLSESEVSQRTLPDHLTSNLDIVIVSPPPANPNQK